MKIKTGDRIVDFLLEAFLLSAGAAMIFGYVTTLSPEFFFPKENFRTNWLIFIVIVILIGGAVASFRALHKKVE